MSEAECAFVCLLGTYLMCSTVLELILFLLCCFYYDGFIHIGACGSLGFWGSWWGGGCNKARKEGHRFRSWHAVSLCLRSCISVSNVCNVCGCGVVLNVCFVGSAQTHALHIGGVHLTMRDTCVFFIYWGCERGSGNRSEILSIFQQD